VLVVALLTRYNVNQNWAGVLFGVGAIQALASGSSLSEDLRLRLTRRRAAAGKSDSESAAAAATPAAWVAPGAPAPSARSPLLAVRGLTVHYGAVTALSDVHLTVPSGVVMGLIGPNGAGKSTLADAVTGFIGYDEGTIELDGVSLAGRPVRERARAGIRRTFQQARVPPSLTVGEYIRFAAGRRIDQIRMRDLLRYLDCPQPEQPIRIVDTGTRRMLEIVGILLSEPKLVILDEPAAGLGHTGSEILGERLATVPAAFGASLLLIEHDLDLIRMCCSTVAVLDFGKVIAEGEPADVLARAEVTAAYLGDVGAVQ
jgi:branched-chain amino acid transport system permease protein